MRRATGGQQGSTLLVDDLARIYTAQRSALVRRATRKVNDPAVAEELVQEAFLKLMLAAPEIQSEDHLLAYLNTTVNNLCITFGQKNGVRPHLVAIDADMSVEEIDDMLAGSKSDMDEDLIRAEDAAIVREALARLTPADRAVLMAGEFEGLSANEIADRYGMTPASVHVALSKARGNLRRVLESWVIDEETGLTAAEYLSRAGRKIADNSKKIGSAALSLVLLVGAFFGFWNNPAPTNQIALEPKVITTPSPSAEPSTTATAEATPTAEATTTAPQAEEMSAQDFERNSLNYLSRSAELSWPGLDANGIPQGFTVNDGGSFAGRAFITNQPVEINDKTGELSTESQLMTFQDGVNVILSQRVGSTNGKVTYSVEPIVRVAGSWIALVISSKSVDIKKTADGNYLITAFMVIDYKASANSMPIAGDGLGYDAKSIPAVVATRLLTNEIGLPIAGQAVQVLAPLVGQS